MNKRKSFIPLMAVCVISFIISYITPLLTANFTSLDEKLYLNLAQYYLIKPIFIFTLAYLITSSLLGKNSIKISPFFKHLGKIMPIVSVIVSVFFLLPYFLNLSGTHSGNTTGFYGSFYFSEIHWIAGIITAFGYHKNK